MSVTVLPNGVILATRAMARCVSFDNAMLHCELQDGRIISVPLSWYPPLLQASPEQRDNWRLIGRGVGIHWPDLDEDLSVRGFMAGCEDATSVSDKGYTQLKDVKSASLVQLSYTISSASQEVELLQVTA